MSVDQIFDFFLFKKSPMSKIIFDFSSQFCWSVFYGNPIRSKKRQYGFQMYSTKKMCIETTR